MGMTHVRTSPYYPQSNGKLERWHGSLKRECIRPSMPAVAGGGAAAGGRVRRALQPRAAALGDRLRHAGRQARGLETVIFAERDRKLEEARAPATAANQSSGRLLDAPAIRYNRQ